MGIEESNIVQRCRIAASRSGARLFRNNRGLFLTLDALPRLRDALKRGGIIGVQNMLNANCLRKVRAGLEVDGSGDLIGWKSITITPEMVGRRIAIFCAAEIKAESGKASDNQLAFIENVQQAGGIAFIARSEQDVIDNLKDESF